MAERVHPVSVPWQIHFGTGAAFAGWRGQTRNGKRSAMNRTFTFSLGGLILLVIIVAILF
ncbi:hypothetical protein RCO27_03690 [Sphingosinicella sp. LHD-64]|uniref:hypothetical protein n=1 Tax=Sphingosinicella sp. LHD-64 TaxID=3072139 RepID=UPI00280EDF1F|nr:hypothetical protein [Sphingosinicella sp. LHD-64]MDQ8755322.1 hypothetical protein [Sphingosinicella sp. LHD-64]